MKKDFVGCQRLSPRRRPGPKLNERHSRLRLHSRQGFTRQHGVTRLVWFECHDSIEAAITREKQIKEWRRDWKVNLIQAMNPEWRDLYDDLAT